MGCRCGHSGRACVAAGRNRDAVRGNPAAMAIGQSALVCSLVGAWRCGSAAVCAAAVDVVTGGNWNSRGDGDAPMNESILTLILLAPLVGAVVVALLPDRGKLPAWIALLTSLASFVLTLHLPVHFVHGQSGFQFEIDTIGRAAC